MIQVSPFSDQRLKGICCYCGELADTRDHVPSKILLDEPYPDNLPVVPCCLKCNNEISLSEEYFACLIECVVNGTTVAHKLKREKIAKILSKKEPLRKRLETAMTEKRGNIYFQTENKRIRQMIIKLAKGHAKFEYDEILFEEPSFIMVKPLESMAMEEKSDFFSLLQGTLLPEVGSRGFQKLFINNKSLSPRWEIVQPRNYQYAVSLNGGLGVKIIIADYLAIVVKFSTPLLQ